MIVVMVIGSEEIGRYWYLRVLMQALKTLSLRKYMFGFFERKKNGLDCCSMDRGGEQKKSYRKALCMGGAPERYEKKESSLQ